MPCWLLGTSQPAGFSAWLDAELLIVNGGLVCAPPSGSVTWSISGGP